MNLRWATISLLLAACPAPQGGEGQACSAMGECFPGLTCLSKLCVRVPPPDGGSMGGGSMGGGSSGGGSSGGGSSGGGAAGVFDQSDFDSSTWQ